MLHFGAGGANTAAGGVSERDAAARHRHRRDAAVRLSVRPGAAPQRALTWRHGGRACTSEILPAPSTSQYRTCPHCTSHSPSVIHPTLAAETLLCTLCATVLAADGTYRTPTISVNAAVNPNPKYPVARALSCFIRHF